MQNFIIYQHNFSFRMLVFTLIISIEEGIEIITDYGDGTCFACDYGYLIGTQGT